jgi:hypothetical protein
VNRQDIDPAKVHAFQSALSHIYRTRSELPINAVCEANVRVADHPDRIPSLLTDGHPFFQ